MQSSHGFDNPSVDREQDDLDRWRFSLDISEVILSTPADWSARIGLFGSWGSGKSTVLGYISSVLKERGSIVVNFNPALDSSFEEVLSSFGIRLFEELQSNGLNVESKTKQVARKIPFFRSKSAPTVVEATGEWFKAAKLASVGLNFVSEWLKPSGEQIRRIRETLPDQKIVVLVDDLDRTSPDLLPKFLLSLRELLDLPRFIFVLAFDDAIVSEALRTQNPGWEQGQDFLDKILDFRFSLPPVNAEGKTKLLSNALSQQASFVPIDSLKEIEDLISDNPRKAKALVRGLRAWEPIIGRHNLGEFDWKDVWLVQILRQESHVLVDKLIDSDTYNNVLGPSYRFLQSASQRNQINGPLADKPQELLDKVGISGASAERVRKIFDAIRARSSIHFQYVLSWNVKPPAVTWKEFDSLLTTWSADPRAEFLQEVMQAHAVARLDSEANVQDEMVTALLTKMENLWNAALYVPNMSDLISAYQPLVILRLALLQIFEIDRVLNATRFMALYQKTQQWTALRRNPEEMAARIADQRNLIDIAGLLVGSEVADVFAKIGVGGHRFSMLSASDQAMRDELRVNVVNVLQPKVEAALADFLRSPGCIKLLQERDRYSAYKILLFDEERGWTNEVRSSLVDLVQRGASNEEANRNVNDLVDLLGDIQNYRSGDVAASAAKVFLADEEILRGIWNSACSRELLPNRSLQLLVFRQRAIDSGVSEALMPLNKQLEEQIPVLEANREEFMRSL